MPRRPAPLRQHGFRIAVFAIGPILGLVAVLVAAGALVSQGVDVPPALLIGLVVATLVIPAAAIAIGLRLGNRLVGDRLELAVKPVGGKWGHARFDVDPGIVHMQPYLWQIRIPKGDRVSLHVDELGEDTGRRPHWRQWWSLNPQLHIVDLRTDRGHYELAGIPAHLEELRDRLSTG